jgi:3-oxoadipyl-CoA thiolase
MGRAVIVDAIRTPIGRFGGALSEIRPDDLAAHALRAVIARSGITPSEIDEVVLGCANQAGEDNRNVARMALLLAGLPHEVPGVTVNRLCASGLEAVNQAARMVRCGDARLVVAGGVESMSRAPYSMPRGPQQPKAGNFQVWDTSLGWRYPNPKLQERFPLESMGETAENIVEELKISRQDQDAFALRSHQRAVAAQESGAFEREIVPVEVAGPKGSKTVVSRDEGPRKDSTLEALAKLPATFRKGGSVTAGNASPLNDGAAALVIADEDYARSHKLPIRATILSMASAGVDPRTMGYGPVPASQLACHRAGISVSDVELWELNEAFAAQALGVVQKLGIDAERVNVFGGAIALGHPLGCSGARILTTLLTAMEARDAKLGCASLCVGVGQGVATVISRG